MSSVNVGKLRVDCSPAEFAVLATCVIIVSNKVDASVMDLSIVIGTQTNKFPLPERLL